MNITYPSLLAVYYVNQYTFLNKQTTELLTIKLNPALKDKSKLI